jgi:hypothetical protein
VYSCVRACVCMCACMCACVLWKIEVSAAFYYIILRMYVCMYCVCVCVHVCIVRVCVCVCVRKCEMSRILLLTCKFTEALYVDCFAVHSNRKWTLVWTEARQWSCHKALACGDGKYMPIDCV